MGTPEYMSDRPVQVLGPGEELRRRISQQELLVLDQVPFETFVNLIAGKGFTHILHLNSSKVDEDAYVGAGAGTTKMIFTDGHLPHFVIGNFDCDCWSNNPTGASYCAQIKTPPTEQQMSHQEPGIAETQVLIISNRKAKEIRRLFSETPGLENVDLSCRFAY